MKKNKFSKILFVTLLSGMILTMAACSSKETPSAASDVSPSSSSVSESSPSSSSASSSSTAASAAGEMSEEEYVTKVNTIMADVTAKSTEAMTGIDANDLEAIVKATTDMITTVTPMYEELTTLSAPAKYAEADAKIKSGAEASLEMLQISMSIFENGADETKLAELQAQAGELAPKAQALADGVAMLQQ